MEGTYGPSGPESCKDLEELSKIIAESRDPKELKEAWTGWHAISNTACLRTYGGALMRSAACISTINTHHSSSLLQAHLV